MGTTSTPNLNLIKPNPFEEEDAWGPILNTNWDKVDVLGSVSAKAIAAVTPAADRLPYFTSGTAATVTALTSFARTILDDADAATARTTLGAAGLGANTFIGNQTIVGALLYNNGDSTNNYSISNAGASGAANAVLIFNQGGLGERMRIDASGNVGIGSSGTNRINFSYNSGTGVAKVGPNSTSGNTTFQLGTSNAGTYADRLTIDSSGNVGIGRTPVYKLDAAINSGGAARFATDSGTPANDAGVIMFTTSSATPASREAGVYIDGNGGDGTGADYAFFLHRGDNRAILGNQSAGTLEFQTSGTERMRVTSAGDVGIGTASPNEKFHIRSSGSVYARIQCDNAGAGAGLYFTNNTTNWLIGAGPVSGAGEFVFYDVTRSAERIRITINGGVAFGGATNYGTSGQVLQSNGDAPPSWTTPAAVTTANVLSATAGASAGAVGTYAFLKFITLTNANPGDTYNGSVLYYANANGTTPGNISPAGSWRLMGNTNNVGGAQSTSLWLRIS